MKHTLEEIAKHCIAIDALNSLQPNDALERAHLLVFIRQLEERRNTMLTYRPGHQWQYENRAFAGEWHAVTADEPSWDWEGNNYRRAENGGIQ